MLRKAQPKTNVVAAHATIEEGAVAKPALDTANGQTIKVFCDEKAAMTTLKDQRFEFVDSAQDAQIYWLIGIQRNNYRD